uniref:Uncharacterized protein n=1 Tax=Nothoprocta perdicaria TaxID=30464 RepID=A0A8C6ZDH3_NOTPE
TSITSSDGRSSSDTFFFSAFTKVEQSLKQSFISEQLNLSTSTSFWAVFLDTGILSSLFLGGLKLKPNREPVAEVFPNVNVLDFSLLKILLTDSEPNTNFGGETTVFVGVSEVLDTSEASTVTSAVSSSTASSHPPLL